MALDYTYTEFVRKPIVCDPRGGNTFFRAHFCSARDRQIGWQVQRRALAARRLR